MRPPRYPDSRDQEIAAEPNASAISRPLSPRITQRSGFPQESRGPVQIRSRKPQVGRQVQAPLGAPQLSFSLTISQFCCQNEQLGADKVVGGAVAANWPVLVTGGILRLNGAVVRDENGAAVVNPDKIFVPPDAKTALINLVHNKSHHGQARTFNIVRNSLRESRFAPSDRGFRFVRISMV